MTLVVDTSALMAILFDEPMADAVTAELAAEPDLIMSSATLVEASIVVESRLGPEGTHLLQRLLRDVGVRVVDLTERSAHEAITGWREFGKGRHSAALNLGDCYAYGEARVRDAPILCTGGDFAQTEVSTRP